MNINYQVFSVCDSPIPASTSTPTFDSEFENDTAMVTVIPEIPEHFILSYAVVENWWNKSSDFL